ncbi:hypothetical protein ETU10_08460 [Apibacter muscae]|uniref:hypothetical protein n=1 Tax=Apibacter muscae TaxID=2509004 RepID=UPI0011AC47D2|nr:hypothetical protein [Apibacter muscae]TWP23118.1 hypothetical protein ETU10_08460 [Apibacter muscae]
MKEKYKREICEINKEIFEKTYENFGHYSMMVVIKLSEFAKDNNADNLVDAYFLLIGLANKFDVKLDAVESVVENFEDNLHFYSRISNIYSIIEEFSSNKSIRLSISNSLAFIEKFCQHYNIDLEGCILEKIKILNKQN